jgi:twitching motility protein PilI
MAKRGKSKGKGKPQQAAAVQAASPEADLAEAQPAIEAAPAEAVDAVDDAATAPEVDAEIQVEEAVVVEVVAAAVEEAPSKPVKPAKPLHKPRLKPRDKRSPFLVLADYEQRSLAHIAGLPEQMDAPGLWRGVAYRVGSHRLASGFGEVVEILSMPALTPVPGSQPWMLGVANVRGTLLPVVDLKQFLEGERTVLHESQRVLVVRQPGGDVAVTIDEMYGQRSFVDAQGTDAGPVSEGRYGYFIDRAYRINDQDWGVFSLERLARTPEFRQAAA